VQKALQSTIDLLIQLGERQPVRDEAEGASPAADQIIDFQQGLRIGRFSPSSRLGGLKTGDRALTRAMQRIQMTRRCQQPAHRAHLTIEVLIDRRRTPTVRCWCSREHVDAREVVAATISVSMSPCETPGASELTPQWTRRSLMAANFPLVRDWAKVGPQLRSCHCHSRQPLDGQSHVKTQLRPCEGGAVAAAVD